MKFCSAIVNGSLSLLPKALSSASSLRANEMQLLMPSSQVQVRGVYVAQREEWHHWQNPDQKMSADCRLQTKWHSIRAFAKSSFQQLVHACGKKSLVPTHTVDEHQIQLNQTLRLGCTKTADRLAVQDPDYFVLHTSCIFTRDSICYSVYMLSPVRPSVCQMGGS